MDRQSDKDPPARGDKRPYQPPRIVSREPLEVVAGICVGFDAKSAPPQCGLLGGILFS